MNAINRLSIGQQLTLAFAVVVGLFVAVAAWTAFSLARVDRAAERIASVSLAKGTLFKRAKLYIPALGMPGGGDSLGIPANALHKAAALLWTAYLVEADVRKQMNATIGSYLADMIGQSSGS